MRIVGRMERLGDLCLSCQSDRENGSWILSASKSEVHPRRDCRVWSGGRSTRDDTMCEEITESLVDLEDEKRAVYRTAGGKLIYMCQERADIMYSVEETARKDHVHH